MKTRIRIEKKLGFLLTVLLISAGCARPTTISGMYALDEKLLQKSAAPIPLRVMVAVLRDARPEEEKLGSGKAKGYNATRESDDIFEDMLGEITEALVKHFRAVRLFADVQITVYSLSELRAGRLIEIRDKADAVLYGNVEHFYGIVYREPAGQERMAGVGAGAAIAGGALGAAVVFGLMVGVESAISKEVEGHAALTDLKLVETKNLATLWEGSVEAQFRREQKGLPDTRELAIEALKQAVTSLVEKLRSANLKTSGIDIRADNTNQGGIK